MSGVAVTLNPLPVNPISTVNQNVLLWYVTKDKQLGVDIHLLQENSWSRYRNGGASLGSIRVSTSLASAVHNRTLAVYGITTYEDSDDQLRTVSRLTPTYTAIDPVADRRADPGKYDAIAAASNNVDHDYVYFLQNADDKKPRITEFTFNMNNPGTKKVFRDLGPDPASNLATIYEPRSRTRLILFQGNNDGTDPFIHYSWSDSGYRQSIRGTNNSLKGTPLAATIVTFDDTTIEIYVYYIDNINKLTRVVYTGTKSAGSWGTQQEIYDAGDVATTSGLAALADTNRDGNHVYFKRPDMSAYVSYLDHFKRPVSVDSVSFEEADPENDDVKVVGGQHQVY